MANSTMNILMEQKLAENTLLLANAQKMVEVRREQGQFLVAKGWQRKADELSRQRRELLQSMATVSVNEEE